MHLQLGDAGGHRVHSSLYSAARETNVRRGFFERSELSRITAALPVHMRGVAEFAFVTGWRTPSAILTLQWQVDFEAGEVRLDPGTTKNGDGRVFPMTTGLRRTLQQQRAVADQLERERGVTPQAVFCYRVGRRAGHPISAVAYIHEWWRARVRAGCPDRIPHDFRRTAVRNLVRAGVPERVAMHLTGHKTRAVFERYNITSPNDLRRRRASPRHICGRPMTCRQTRFAIRESSRDGAGRLAK
jgi:Phage integrase family